MFSYMMVTVSALLVAVQIEREEKKIDSMQIQEIHRSIWESIGTLHFVQESRLDEGGIETYEYEQGEENSRSVIIWLENDKGKKQTYETREDGRKRVILRPGEQTKGGEISTDAIIQPQNNTRDRYRGIMTDVLWILQPRGNPLYELTEDIKSFEEIKSPDDHYVLVTTSIKGNSTLSYELDAAHDWLPRKIYSNRGEFEIKVDKFEKIDGYWFPVAGTHKETAIASQNGVKLTKNYSFITKKVRINKLVDQSKFVTSKLPDGASVADWITNKRSVVGQPTHGRVGIQRENQTGQSKKTNRELQEPIHLEEKTINPNSNWLNYAITALALSVLFIAIIAKMRSR